MIKLQKLLIIIAACFTLFIALSVEAAVLSLESTSGKVTPGQIFIAGVSIDPAGECINAAEVKINFPKDLLQIKDFGRGQSILTYWVAFPGAEEIATANQTGILTFSGGIPGGWCGRINGDIQGSNLLAKIIFQAISGSVKPVEIKIDTGSQVLLNNGQGTGANLTVQNATLDISAAAKVSSDEWVNELKKDAIPPENFEISLQKDSQIFDGSYFIVFFTTDKQTGIDRYEISETSASDTDGKDNWIEAQSPYLLKDQSLRSKIKVKAVDKAGNATIAESLPPSPGWFSFAGQIVPYWPVLLVILLLVVIVAFRKIKQTTQKNNDSQ